MSDRRFKTLLSKLSGLTIVAEELFLTDNDRLLVVARILDMHPADGPDQRLDKETLHDSLLKLMETCHAERDAMWFRSRMEPRFWMRVRASTPWAGGLDFEVLRTLALGLTQAAWAHFKDPKRNKNGDPQPCCKLAMASLQFASDINVYEGHLKPEKLNDMNFSEWRGPVYLENGKRLQGRNKKLTTTPVFPIYRHDIAFTPRAEGNLSQDYDLTADEPEIFKILVRV